MSDDKTFEDCKDELPISVIYALAKYGYNTRKYFKKHNMDPDNFMEMITCNTNHS
ncbi:hypothetical protein [uncultured Methanobrevibacter sp.]|uniref:hypothetical protein n=1 Tax=uncultured Methanobrevibacter sp. TaxID=253161 RepID=UPI0025DB6659|nr:hypothetical protein [uncultured Methanobrevibacter sp.]